MEPIVLDQFGATLTPRGPEQKDWIENYLGRHEGCNSPHGGGSMDVVWHSQSHRAIACRGCFLRIIIPRGYIDDVVSLGTFTKIRAWFSRAVVSGRPVVSSPEHERVGDFEGRFQEMG